MLQQHSKTTVQHNHHYYFRRSRGWKGFNPHIGRLHIGVRVNAVLLTYLLNWVYTIDLELDMHVNEVNKIRINDLKLYSMNRIIGLEVVSDVETKKYGNEVELDAYWWGWTGCILMRLNWMHINEVELDAYWWGWTGCASDSAIDRFIYLWTEVFVISLS